MLDFYIALVIVIGLIFVLGSIINVAVRKIGNVICIGGDEDRSEDLFEHE